MKFIIKPLSLVFAISMLFACSEQELLLKDGIPMFENDGSPRTIAKPDDIEVLAGLNKKIRIIWPEIGKGVRAAKVVVKRGEYLKEVEVKDFETDLVIDVDEPGEHDVEIKYLGVNTSESKIKYFKALPGDFEVDIIVRDAQVTPLAGKVKFSFKKYLMNNYTYTINYKYNGEDFEKVFVSGVDSLDEVIISNLKDDSHLFEFNIQIKDDVLGFVSPNEVKSISPLPLAHVIVQRLLGVTEWFNGAILNWSNVAKEPVKVVVSYMFNGTRYTREKISSLTTDTLGISDLNIGGVTELSIYTEGEDGDQTLAKPYNVSPSVTLKQFNTQALKVGAGWVQTTSTAHPGDGDAANSLIDGNVGTYWQSRWSGPATPYPHWAAFRLPTFYKFTKVTITNRDHQTANPYKDFIVQTSVDGVTYTNHQSFTNTVNIRAGVATFTLDKPLITKYVRLFFTSSLPGNFGGSTQTAHVNIAEVSFDGYKEN